MSEYVFKLPDLGEGTVESEIGEWNIKVGDLVEEEAIVGTMMTDKAAIELNSPVRGTVVSLAGQPGDMVAVGSPLIIFETEGAAPAAANANGADSAEAAKQASPATGQKADRKAKVIASPAIRRRAREAGIDLAEVPATGSGGRILRKDFDRFLKDRGASVPARGPATEPSKTEEIRIIGLRRIIAERMAEANREVPHFSYVEEVDITELEALRRHLNGRQPGDAARLTLLPFLAIALIRALKEFPQCNSTHDKDRNLLLRHSAVHLGIATQTADGLKVPVVKNAETLSLSRLAGEIGRLAEAARSNTAKKSELTGSTITITSLGKLGGIVSTPVINLPEVAIIGVNRAVERPAVVDGQIAVRRMMNLSSSFDHRFVDGYDAAAMIQLVKDMLEHPATMFID